VIDDEIDEFDLTSRVALLINEGGECVLGRSTVASLVTLSLVPDILYKGLIDKVKSIEAKQERPTEDDLADLIEMRSKLASLPGGETRLRELEKELLLWPRRVAGMPEMIEIATGAQVPPTPWQSGDHLQEAAGGEFDEQSQRGQFTEADGARIKDGLTEDAVTYAENGNKCLSFLYTNGLARLLADHADRVDEAKHQYTAGVEDRERGLHSTGTLSRLAAELRLQGLVGPVHLLHWRDGMYQPTATDLLDALSAVGTGWYFFMVSAGSWHTFAVAVQVTGEARTYFRIQDGASTAWTAAHLNSYIDKFGPKYRAATRIWQIYVEPDAPDDRE